MDSPFLTFFFLSLGFSFSLFAPLVHSGRNVNIGTQLSPPGQPPSPSPPPSPSSSPLPPSSPPHRRPFPSHAPPPWRRPHAAMRSPHPPSQAHAAVRSPHPPSQSFKQKRNLGKKIGLIFTGVVAIMQVGVVAFLLIERRQLLKNNNGL